jgi:hypothetical protein
MFGTDPAISRGRCHGRNLGQAGWHFTRFPAGARSTHDAGRAVAFEPEPVPLILEEAIPEVVLRDALQVGLITTLPRPSLLRFPPDIYIAGRSRQSR